MRTKLVLLSKRNYKPFVPLHYNDKMGIYATSLKIFNRLMTVLATCTVIIPIGTYGVYYYYKKRELAYDKHFAHVEEHINQPEVRRRKEIEKTPWFRRLDAERNFDYNEMKLIVRSFVEAKNDREKFEILNSERPWKIREEFKMKKDLEKFMQYPNYYKNSVSEVLEEEENEE